MSEELFCCSNCFTDNAIKAFIEGSDTGKCSFCGSKDVSIIAIYEIAEFIDEGINRKYEDAAQHIPYESAEGGYQWDTLSVEVVLRDHEQIFEDAPQSVNPPLSEVLASCSSFSSTPLVVRHPFSGPGDYIEQWEQFCNVVKHESRFTVFLHYAGHAKDWLAGDPPSAQSNLLSPLWLRIDETLPILVRDIPVGNKYYRARTNPAADEFTHEELTSPPRNKTRNNRMSPIGISCFYGAEDLEICLAEMRPYLGAEIVIAEFKTLKPITLLDLVDMPPPVSIFDGEHYWFELEAFMKPFLLDFSHAIARPIAPGDEILEYVPTQVFCEFIKNNYWKHQVHGIRYRSALRQDGVSIVLFQGPEVSLGPDPWLIYSEQFQLKITDINHHYNPV